MRPRYGIRETAVPSYVHYSPFLFDTQSPSFYLRAIATTATTTVAAIGMAATAATQKQTFRIAQTANVMTQTWSPTVLAVARAGITFSPVTASVTMPTTTVLVIGTAVTGEILLLVPAIVSSFFSNHLLC